MNTSTVNQARGLGYVKDRTDTRDFDAFKAGFLKADASPVSATNADLVKVVDQGGLGSCTANAAGQAIRAAEVLERAAAIELKTPGLPPGAAIQQAQAELEFWARLFAYFLARAYDGNTSQDTGTEIRLIFQAINKYGFPPESAWPYSDDSSPGAAFSRMPSADAFRKAYDQRASVANANIIDYARITSTGTQRIADIKAAIAQRHLVVFGTLVTNAFCSDSTGNNGSSIAPPTTQNDIAGGHALCVGGYDGSSAHIVNSWSEQWGGQGGLPPGWCRFSWDYMTWDQTTDLWIVRKAPLIAQAA